MILLKQLIVIITIIVIPILSFGQETNSQHKENYVEFIQNLNCKVTLDSLKSINSDEFFYYSSWCNLMNGKIAIAHENATKYINVSNLKHRYETQILIGLIHSKRLVPNFALSAFDKAIKIDPYRPEAYLEKMKVYVEQNQINEGLAFANKSLKKFPNEIKLNLYRGILNLKSNLYKKAVQDFNKVISPNQQLPNELRAKAYYGLTKCSLHKKDYKMADEYSQKSVFYNPNHAKSYALIGEIKFKFGDLDAALKAFNKMEETLRYINYYPMIARIHELKGNIKLACAYYNASCDTYFPDQNACKKLKKLNCVK